MSTRKKTYTDETGCLDIHGLKREGKYRDGITSNFWITRHVKGQGVRVSVAATDDTWRVSFHPDGLRPVSETIYIGWVRDSGGACERRQNHFQCPQCGYHCRKLYLLPNGLRCKRCADLGYRRQGMTKSAIQNHQIDQLLSKFNSDLTLKRGHGGKTTRTELLTKLLRKVRDKDASVRTQVVTSIERIEKATRP